MECYTNHLNIFCSYNYIDVFCFNQLFYMFSVVQIQTVVVFMSVKSIDLNGFFQVRNAQNTSLRKMKKFAFCSNNCIGHVFLLVVDQELPTKSHTAQTEYGIAAWIADRHLGLS